jgi:deoxyribodipyrimidine photolyase-related protein
VSSAFRAALARHGPAPGERRWLYVPYDQLSGALGPLAREEPRELGIVLIESPWKAARRPYHRQKLALVLANQRHFALEQAARGVAVRHVVARGPFALELRALVRELGPLRVMQPAERELAVELAPLANEKLLALLPHEGWLTEPADLSASQAGPPWRMDAFYRHVRRRTGILMERGKPRGGKFSFDTENRRAWRGTPAAPEPPRTTPDEITREVLALVEREFAHHPGTLTPDELPATRADAERLLAWAVTRCLPHFGPFEDAFSELSRSLFHTRLAPLLNLHRLTPRQVLDAALAAELPLASLEGFVRQLLGWREFVHHVHVASDGFRASGVERAGCPGDGGFAAWSGRAWPASADGPDGGARPSFLEAHGPLPPTYWGRPSGLRCLDATVAQVWREGYTHHIPRLMVLANLATLLAVEPRELTDWFWAAFTDAYDWVVEPNVLGMGTFAVGELMTTKPYVCGAAYIARMGDHCRSCRFDPRMTCPITALYWDFLARNAERLSANHRLAVPLRAAAQRSPAQRSADARRAAHVRVELAAGLELAP